MRRAAVLAAGLLLALALVGPSSLARAPLAGSASPPTVYAAASLTEVFQKVQPNARYNFAGSNQLALQIRQGAPADVFASAAPSFTQSLYRAGLVEKPRTLAYNRLVMIVPKSNPAGLTSVWGLRRSGIKLVIAAPAVPVGSYTRKVLRNLGLSRVLENVVSQEPDVKSVVGKVALGEADAGFCYVTDVKPVGDRVNAIQIPAWAQPRARYEIAIVKAGSNKAAARAFVKRVLGPIGRGNLSGAGFILP